MIITDTNTEKFLVAGVLVLMVMVLAAGWFLTVVWMCTRRGRAHTKTVKDEEGMEDDVVDKVQEGKDEEVHGSAPDIAGKNIANPSGLLNAAIYMLGFIDQREVADKIYKAWSQTIEDGLHTADIFDKKTSKAKISTTEFTKEVIKNLNCLKPSADLSASILPKADFKIDNQKDEQKKLLIGADCFIAYKSCNLDQLLESFKSLQLKKELILASINAKGIQLWPEKPITSELYSDVLCCRFLGKENSTIESVDIKDLFSALTEQSFEVIKLENLYLFGDKAGFSM